MATGTSVSLREEHVSIRSVLSQDGPRNERMYTPGDFAGLGARVGREIEERHANGGNDGRRVHPVKERALVREQHLRLDCTPQGNGVLDLGQFCAKETPFLYEQTANPSATNMNILLQKSISHL